MSGSKYIKNLVFRFFSALRFLLRSQNAHSLHSPFAYYFYNHILHPKEEEVTSSFSLIEQKRASYLKSDERVSGIEFGANGSGERVEQKLARIARSSLKKPSRARLICRIAALNEPKTIIEFGTCLGITTAYLASSLGQAQIITMEGNHARSVISRKFFLELGIENILLEEGEFSGLIDQVLKRFPLPDVVFLDGNHRRIPTLYYYSKLRPHLHEKSIVIVDDIRWSGEMFAAWLEMKSDAQVQMSIELMDMGILFFKKEIFPQHFFLRG